MIGKQIGIFEVGRERWGIKKKAKSGEGWRFEPPNSKSRVRERESDGWDGGGGVGRVSNNLQLPSLSR